MGIGFREEQIMLKFRAINDFQGIRKGQVWELKSVNENKSVCLLVRKIGKIESRVRVWEEVLENNFEWVKE